MKTRICKYCGMEFQPARSNMIFCKDEDCVKRRRNEQSKRYYQDYVKERQTKPENYKKVIFKEKLTLAEKEQYCRELGIDYGKMQTICASYDTRERVIAKLESIRRANFVRESMRNANNTNVIRPDSETMR